MFKTPLSKFQYSFKQEFSGQHCLLLMVEKKKEKLDTTKEFLLRFLVTYQSFCLYTTRLTNSKTKCFWFR